VTSVGYGKLAEPGALDSLQTQRGLQDAVFTPSGYGVSYTNPTRTVSFRERLMAETILVNLNSANAGGFNLQLSSAPAKGRGGTCFGDSGGPVHWGGFNSTTIVGVNSFVLNNNCAGVGFAYRVDSTAVQNWILGVIGATEFAKIQFAS
jgi:trypsin